MGTLAFGCLEHRAHPCRRGVAGQARRGGPGGGWRKLWVRISRAFITALERRVEREIEAYVRTHGNVPTHAREPTERGSDARNPAPSARPHASGQLTQERS